MYVVYSVMEDFLGEIRNLMAIFNTEEEATEYEAKLIEIHEKYPPGIDFYYTIENFENKVLSDIEARYRSNYETEEE